MKKLAPFMVLILIAGLPTGCIIIEHRHTGPPPEPPPDVKVITYTDCAYVIMLEYFDCDWATIRWLETYHPLLTCCDWFIAFYIANHTHRPFRDVIVLYERCAYSWVSVAVHLNFNLRLLFVDIPKTVYLGPPFGRAYGYYWRKPGFKTLTKQDIYNVVHLNILVNFYGFNAVDIIHRVQTEGVSLERIIEIEYRHAGRTGVNFKGKPLIKKERPWDRRTRARFERQKKRVKKAKPPRKGPSAKKAPGKKKKPPKEKKKPPKEKKKPPKGPHGRGKKP
jgi:hypothetical protein